MHFEIVEKWKPLGFEPPPIPTLNVRVEMSAGTKDPDGIDVIAYRGVAYGPHVRLDNRGGKLTISAWPSDQKHEGKPPIQFQVE